MTRRWIGLFILLALSGGIFARVFFDSAPQQGTLPAVSGGCGVLTTCGISTGSGCGVFPSGICNPNPLFTSYQAANVCPAGPTNSSIFALIVGCYDVPIQLVQPIVPQLVAGFTVLLLISAFIGPFEIPAEMRASLLGPPEPRDTSSPGKKSRRRRRRKDRRSSLL